MDKNLGKWLCSVNRNENAERNLIIFPHAGGNAMYYLPMEKYIIESCKLMIVNLPGRDVRADVPMYRSLRKLAQDFTDENASVFNSGTPYTIMGHSMGAVIAYETASYIEEKNYHKPEALVVSGEVSPKDAEKSFSNVSDNEKAIMEYLISLGGMSEQMLETDEFLEYYLPIIISDFKACRNYKYVDRPKLSVPVHVFYGESDNSNEPLLYANWQNYTSNICTLTGFEGGHFFIQDSIAEVCGRLTALLEKG